MHRASVDSVVLVQPEGHVRGLILGLDEGAIDCVGATEGAIEDDGEIDCFIVGLSVGNADGELVGLLDGTPDGRCEGCMEGDVLGPTDGFELGLVDGATLIEGLEEGISVKLHPLVKVTPKMTSVMAEVMLA